MTDAPINVLQQLMRGWESQYPYNAAQVMTLAPGVPPERWQAAWQETTAASGLGRLCVNGSRYRFDGVDTGSSDVTDTAPFVATDSLDEHITHAMGQPFTDGSALRPFVRLGSSRTSVGLVYRHWIADGVSIQRLMEAWLRRAHGEPVRPLKIQLPRGGFWRSVGPGPLGWSVPMEMLRVARRHIRLRRAAKIDGAGLDDPRTRFCSVPTPPGLIVRLRPACAAAKVTLNDLFLAALLESCARHIPRQPRPNRPDVAVGSIADLRPAADERSFGMLLGFMTAVGRSQDLSDFDRLLRAVSRQTRGQKADGIAALSLLWSAVAALAARIEPPGRVYHFYRKVFPLLGGLSNVDMTRTWAANYPELLWEYQRVSPTGPMVPLVLTTTTLGERFTIGLTHRTALISPCVARQIGEMFVRRLEDFGQTCSNSRTAFE